jgi:hypothetical protein
MRAASAKRDDAVLWLLPFRARRLRNAISVGQDFRWIDSVPHDEIDRIFDVALAIRADSAPSSRTFLPLLDCRAAFGNGRPGEQSSAGRHARGRIRRRRGD